MIDLTKSKTPTMTGAEANAHYIQVHAQLRVLLAWQDAHPTVADGRVTGVIESLREADAWLADLSGVRPVPPPPHLVWCSLSDAHPGDCRP